jgi:long-chain acyl-CoA synthetase
LKEMDVPKLRYVQQAGGHLAPGFVRELQQALPHARIYVMYGQTEATARLSYLPPECLNDKLGSVGKGIPGVTLRVLNEAGKEVLPGEIGEIVAEGANITRGYWHSPEDTAACFRDGKLHTGDLATVDDEGFIFIVDRAKDFLKCGGKRVSCRQIEEKLLQFASLVEVAVIGIPDEILGEAVKAVVVARTPASPTLKEDLFSFCKEHFPHQLVPRAIVLRDALPKNSAGKVLKQELRSA